MDRSLAIVNVDTLSHCQIMSQPDDELTGRAAVYGMAQTIPDKSLVSELVTGFMDVIYSTE